MANNYVNDIDAEDEEVFDYDNNEDQKNQLSKISVSDDVKRVGFKLPATVKDVVETEYSNNVKKYYENLLQRVTPKNETEYCERVVYFVRHGQCDNRQEGHPLSSLGRKQAELLGKRLQSLHIKFDKISTSTMKRAMYTGLIARAELADKPEIRAYTDLVECSYNKLLDNGYAKTDYIYQTLEKLLKIPSLSDQKKKYENVLCVCHANIIQHFISCIRGELQQYPVGHTSVTRVTVASNGVVNVDYFNDDSHCPADMRTTANLF